MIDSSSSLLLPKQVRSQARRERILDAAETVFSDVDFESASIAKIMARAKSSVGIFYQRFRSKEDVFEQVVERFVDDSIERTNLLLAATPASQPREVIARVIPILVETYRNKRGLLRAILLRASVDARIHALAHRAEQHIQTLLLDLDRSAESASPKHRAMVAIGYQMLRSSLNTMTLYDVPSRAGLSLDDDRLAGLLTEAFLRIIGAGAVSRRRSTKAKVKSRRSTLSSRKEVP